MRFLFLISIVFVILSSQILAYNCFDLDKNIIISQKDTRLKLEHTCEDALDYRVEDKLGFLGDSFNLGKGDSLFVDLFFNIDQSYVFDDLFINNGIDNVKLPMLVLSNNEYDFDISVSYNEELEVKLFNLAEFRPFIINYFIYDLNGNLIYDVSDLVEFQNQKVLRRSFSLNEGQYFIVAQMIKDDKNTADAIFVDLTNKSYIKDSSTLYTLIIFLAFLLLFWFVLRRPKVFKELKNRHNQELKELCIGKRSKTLKEEQKQLILLKKFIERLHKKGLKRFKIKKLCLEKFDKALVEEYFGGK